MPQQTLANRVLALERQMDGLSTLPERMDRLESQVLQLRDEMRAEFSAIRGETAREFGRVQTEFASVRTEFATVRTEMAAEFKAVRSEMATEFTAVRSEMAAEFRVVREEIKEGDGETRRQMRVLHEEVLARLTLLQEAYRDPGAPSRPRRPRGRTKG